MGNLQDFARKELELAGFFDKDSMYAGMLGEAVMKLIDVFSDEGHSGTSASITVNAFERVARFEPLTPLTGEDDEWNEVTEGMLQNKRCSHVFKKDGRAYDSEGRVFRQASGSCFLSRDSFVDITFPYVPKREYVDVP